LKVCNKTSDLLFQKEYKEPIHNISKPLIYHCLFLVFYQDNGYKNGKVMYVLMHHIMEVKLHPIIKLMGVELIKLNTAVTFLLPTGTA
jgi:hypothetical protein